MYVNEAFGDVCFAAFIANLRAILGKKQPAIVVDIGSGGGEYSKLLGGLYETYVGLEPSDIPLGRKMDNTPDGSSVLVHYDPSKRIPICDSCADVVMFISSYDHILERSAVIAEASRILVPNGYLVIGMTNYSFWAKRLANWLAGGKRFMHDHDHYCVHTPDSLKQEVQGFDPSLRFNETRADFFFAPNVPHYLGWVYFSAYVIRLIDRILRLIIRVMLGVENAGSAMFVVFRKTENSKQGES